MKFTFGVPKHITLIFQIEASSREEAEQLLEDSVCKFDSLEDLEKDTRFKKVGEEVDDYFEITQYLQESDS